MKLFYIKKIQDALGHTFHLDQRLVLGLEGRRLPSLRQMKYLFRLLKKSEKRALALFSIILIVSTGFLASRFYLEHRIFIPAFGGEYAEALVGVPRNINPLYAHANPIDADLSSLVYSGLLRQNGKGLLEPDIAESYEISDNLKTYTFKLRRGVKFHDDVELNADDVIFTLLAIQDQVWKSSLAASFAGVKIEKIDDLTIKLNLGEPFTPFLETLTVGILPKHLWQGIKPSEARFSDLNVRPVGTGPFKFRSSVRGKDGSFRSYILERNELFYRKAPYLDRVTFHFFSSYEEAADALNGHVVSGVSYFSASFEQNANRGKSGAGELIGDLDKNPEVEYYKLKLPQYTALFLNMRRNDILADAKIRKAITLALDKETIWREAIKKEGSLINAPILEGFTGYDKDIKPTPFDPIKSAEILEGGGWKLPTATSTVRAKKGQTLTFRLATIDRAEHLKAASIILENLKNVGIEIVLETTPAVDFQRDFIRPRNYDMLLYGEVLGLDPDPYPFWHSSQIDDPGLNLSGFINRDADKLLEEARIKPEAEDRAVRYRAFQEILAEEIPAIFLYAPNYIYPQRKTVKGFDVALLSVASDRFSNIEDWYIKTKRTFK